MTTETMGIDFKPEETCRLKRTVGQEWNLSDHEELKTENYLVLFRLE